jgi:hypothetical protein
MPQLKPGENERYSYADCCGSIEVDYNPLSATYPTVNS